VDRIVIDSSKKTWHTIEHWNGNQKLRQYGYRPLENDTIMSIFYSPNQDFELIRELYPNSVPAFEGIRYKGKHIGLALFRYDNGNISEKGFRLNGDVGIWKKYNKNGDLFESKDLGNLNTLRELTEIKY